MDKQNRMLQEKVDVLDKSYVRARHEVFELSEALRKQKKLLDKVPKEIMAQITQVGIKGRSR